jgi:AraC-like DNA-binding protein
MYLHTVEIFNYKLYFFDTVVLLGLINAWVFAAVVWSKQPRHLADKLLAALLLVMGMLCAKILLHTLGWWEKPLFRYFPLGFDLWFQPLLYLYVLALTEPLLLQKRLFRRHFFLPVVFLLYALCVYFSSIFSKESSSVADFESSWFYNELKAIEDALSLVLGLFYGILAHWQLKKYHQWVETYTSDTAIPTYHWLRRLMVLTLVVLLLLALMLATQFDRPLFFAPLQAFYVYLVFLIYVFGFFGFRHQVFQTSLDLINKKVAAAADTGLKDLLQKYEQWMLTTQPYLEPELNLHFCAEYLNCSVSSLSAAINLSVYRNFRASVNHFRVEAFKKRITKANFQRETIMSVAYDCGFNSEASFYRIFKETTGLTPKAFLKEK